MGAQPISEREVSAFSRAVAATFAAKQKLLIYGEMCGLPKPVPFLAYSIQEAQFGWKKIQYEGRKLEIQSTYNDGWADFKLIYRNSLTFMNFMRKRYFDWGLYTEAQMGKEWCQNALVAEAIDDPKFLHEYIQNLLKDFEPAPV